MCRHHEDRIGMVEGSLGALVAESPGSVRALRGPGAFCNDIGDVEGVGDARADPIRRLVIDVIGEPEAGTVALPEGLDNARSGARPLQAIAAGYTSDAADRRLCRAFASHWQVAAHSPPGREPSSEDAPWCGRPRGGDGSGSSTGHRRQRASRWSHPLRFSLWGVRQGPEARFEHVDAALHGKLPPQARDRRQRRGPLGGPGRGRED